MNWEVKDGIVCPTTGTLFCKISGARSLNLILWYSGDYYLQKGSQIETSAFGMVVDGNIRPLRILHVFPYSHECWRTFKHQISCPGNGHPGIRHCEQQSHCQFGLCPHGASGR